MFAGSVAVTTVAGITVVVSERSVEVWWVLLTAIVGMSLVLYRFWSNRRGLLLSIPIAVSAICFALFAQSLPMIQRLSGIDLVNSLDLSNRLVDKLREDRSVTTRRWEQFGTDLQFYRLEPLSEYRERANYEKRGPELVEIADENGFLSGRDYFSQRTAIDVFLAGDSVLQGVGTPGIVYKLRQTLPATLYSVSTSGYGPRQKVGALKQFALSKHPRLLVIEFYSGNDATDAIEDDACRTTGEDYRCRLNTTAANRALAHDPTLREFGDFGDFGVAIEAVRGIRTNSLALAFATRIAHQVRTRIAGMFEKRQQIGLADEALSEPGFVHFKIRDDHRQEWVRLGLSLATKSYSELLARDEAPDAKILIVYNPTSYEIYRQILAPTQIDPIADEIATTQSTTLREWARTHGAEFCNLTQAFRERVSNGARGLFSSNDGTHWSTRGTDIAASVFHDCLSGALAKDGNQAAGSTQLQTQ